MEIKEFKVELKSEEIRLDKFINEKIPDKSRSFIQGLAEKSLIIVNGKTRKSNYKLKMGDMVQMEIPEPENLSVEAEEIPLNVLYEDQDLIVIDKPQGMVVHPAVGNYSGTLVNALLNHCSDLSGINGVIRPGIVHRIDKDTSGVLVIAKNDFAHNSLAEQFKEHSITRVYHALVEGVIKEDSGTIDAPLGRNPKDRLKMAVVKNGKRAVTHFKVLERFNSNTLVECRLETGRTHQIRVHMTYINHPLVGDPVYGYKKQKYTLNGQFLHAVVLGFIHPVKKILMEFKSELPANFEGVLQLLRKQLK